MKKRVFVSAVTEAWIEDFNKDVNNQVPKTVSPFNSLRNIVDSVVSTEEEAWQEIEKIYYETISLMYISGFKVESVFIRFYGTIVLCFVDETFTNKVVFYIQFVPRYLNL